MLALETHLTLAGTSAAVTRGIESRIQAVGFELTRPRYTIVRILYLSPEQACGEHVDARTDLFSLGGVLYRLCTGRLPFTGPTTMAVLMALGTDDPTPVRELNPAVPESLAELIHQLLAKTHEGRPRTADEVAKRREERDVEVRSRYRSSGLGSAGGE
mgnify:CR=1 FL=1